MAKSGKNLFAGKRHTYIRPEQAAHLSKTELNALILGGRGFIPLCWNVPRQGARQTVEEYEMPYLISMDFID